jgi:hypothetical protein
MSVTNEKSEAKQPALRPFFSLEGQYSIDAETTPQEMGRDIRIFLESSRALVQAALAETTAHASKSLEGVLFALLYQLDMVDNLADALGLGS